MTKPKPPKGKHSRRPLTPPPDTSRMEMIEGALGAWVSLGSSRAAARATGIEDTTIRGWKVQHPEVYLKVEHERAEAVRVNRAAAATEAAEGLRSGAAQLRARIESGEMEDRDLCAAQRALVETDAHGDRIARLDSGQVTERIGVEGGGEAVDALNAIASELRR